jgi:DNA-binding MarR family transcriptional regulator
MPRITNRERILLALEDARNHFEQYEVPRRFSQPGMASRLSMAQSHISRAISKIGDEGLLKQERRRVFGERRRINAYTLTERGADVVFDLVRAMKSAAVLSPGPEGTLEQSSLLDLLNAWESDGSWRRPADGLGLADLVRSAEIHDGMPMFGAPPDAEIEVEVDDLSSETIGLHLELADLRQSQGDLPGSINHLERAANLHRKRGSTLGEIRCLLAAHTLGRPLGSSEKMVEALAGMRNKQARLDSAMMLYDAISATGGDLSSITELLVATNAEHPEVAIRCYEATLLAGIAGNFGGFDEILDTTDARRSAIWNANLLRVRCLAASRDLANWPEPGRIEAALDGISPNGAAARPALAAQLVLAALPHPIIDNNTGKQLLGEVWQMPLPMPQKGHIGFQLSALQNPAEAMVTLTRLQTAFEAANDAKGIEVCQARISLL